MSKCDEKLDSKTIAKELFNDLSNDITQPPAVDFSDSKYSYVEDLNSDLYTQTSTINLSNLTESSLKGNGVFDKLMQTINIHLEELVNKNGLTSDQTANIYAQILPNILQSSIEFLLTNEKNKWDAITSQENAKIAKIRYVSELVKLEQEKQALALAQYSAKIELSNYSISKLNLANLDAEYDIKKIELCSRQYEYENILTTKFKIEQFRREYLLPAELNKINTEINMADYNRVNKQPLEIERLKEEIKKLKEEVEQARSITLDTRTDGNPIQGVTGKEIEKAEAQIKAFEVKNLNDVFGQILDAFNVNSGLIGTAVELPLQMNSERINNLVIKLLALVQGIKENEVTKITEPDQSGS